MHACSDEEPEGGARCKRLLVPLLAFAIAGLAPAACGGAVPVATAELPASSAAPTLTEPSAPTAVPTGATTPVAPAGSAGGQPGPAPLWATDVNGLSGQTE